MQVLIAGQKGFISKNLVTFLTEKVELVLIESAELGKKAGEIANVWFGR